MLESSPSFAASASLAGSSSSSSSSSLLVVVVVVCVVFCAGEFVVAGAVVMGDSNAGAVVGDVDTLALDGGGLAGNRGRTRDAGGCRKR